MPTCPVCHHDNPPAALFCARCTSPVAVVPLHHLTDADHRLCLAALLEVLSKSQSPATNPLDQDLWSAYLSVFWLRPETALVLYAEARAVRALDLPPADAPWLDLGCGDGVHAALYSGWRFDPAFDAFASLDRAAPDMYNHFDPAQFTAKVERPGRRIDHAIDIKQTAVARATALGAFADVRQADATALPLPDRSVGVIFSNMLRDLGDPLPAALRECRRVLRDDGTLLISAMTPAYADHLYFAPAARAAFARGDQAAAQHLLKLDRGRSVFCQRQLAPDQWQSLLATAGLALRAAHPTVGHHAIRFWDIGLRPFVHALLAQRDAWSKSNLLPQIKTSLMAGLHHLLTPLAATVADGTPCMQLLQVTKA